MALGWSGMYGQFPVGRGPPVLLDCSCSGAIYVGGAAAIPLASWDVRRAEALVLAEGGPADPTRLTDAAAAAPSFEQCFLIETAVGRGALLPPRHVCVRRPHLFPSDLAGWCLRPSAACGRAAAAVLLPALPILCGARGSPFLGIVLAPL